MANVVYNRAKKNLMDGTIDLDTSAIKVLLVTSAYTPDADHNFVSQVSANELVNVSGTGYARKTLSSKTVTQDDTNNLAYFDAADLSYTAINAGTAKAAIVFYDTGSDATAVLIAYIDQGFGAGVATNGSDLTLTWPATGILKLT